MCGFSAPNNSSVVCRHQLHVLQFNLVLTLPRASLVAQEVKKLPAVKETCRRSKFTPWVVPRSPALKVVSLLSEPQERHLGIISFQICLVV